MQKIILIIHNIRSCHNVGSLLRTAEGLGVEKVYITGYTPYPKIKDDTRLPHIAEKLTKQIHKTALGAEDIVKLEINENVFEVIKLLKSNNYDVIGIEQNINSIKLPKYKTKLNIALIVGREVEGIEKVVLDKCDKIVEIPMFGKKESFNVAQAAAMVLYHCRFN